MMELFDADRDGRLSKEEIENIPTLLLKLDLNEDGYVSRDELPRPQGPPGERGRGRFGRRGEGNGPGEDFNPDFRPRRRGRERNGERGRGIDEVPADAEKGTVVFLGGHETDPVDKGRPVVLIAAALGVKPEVFREAFSRVRPAQDGNPSGERARANKQVLMEALGKHGISNRKLDSVSNYYRYDPASGELWKHKSARAKVVMNNGKITGIKLINGGSGYSSAPEVKIAGHEDVKVEATIEFTRNYSTNGRVTSLKIVQ